MKKEFQKRWPKWFDDFDWFECGDGWKDLLWRLCEDIEKLNSPEDFYVCQVKEKFGGLRFYVLGGSDEIYDRINQAENESFKTCEKCGSTQNVTTEGGWLKTLCKECRK